MKCRLCGQETERIAAFPDQPLANVYTPTKQNNPSLPTELFICSCGHVMMGYLADPGALYPGSMDFTGNMAWAFEQEISWIESFFPPPGPASSNPLVVDIGANDGTFLSTIAGRGYTTLGVEPGTLLAECAEARGHHIIRDYFTADLAQQIAGYYGKAYYVTANRVIANVPDVNDFLEGVRRLLAPNGVFVCETSYFPDVVDKMLVETIYHEHYGYDMVHPLTNRLHLHGMELAAVVTTTAKSGSIRLAAQLIGGPWGNSPAVRKSLGQRDTIMDSESRWLSRRPWEPMMDRLDKERQRILHRVREYRVVAGYGAWIPGSAMMHHLGVAGSLSYLIDDNPRLQGLFAPNGLKVLPPNELYNADACVILAPRYADRIRGNHPEYKGQWLVPFVATT